VGFGATFPKVAAKKKLKRKVVVWSKVKVKEKECQEHQ
jgi:hypothetical protein